jgi:hypothetical protein
MDTLTQLSFDDLSEPQPEDTKTFIERQPTGNLTQNQAMFLSQGMLILKRFLPDDLITAYCRDRAKLPRNRQDKSNYWGGWHYPTPYMDVPTLRDLALYPRLMDTLGDLIGEPMGLHLCLTGWESTERDWHQDSYLNPPNVWSRYVAVWMALDDIDPQSGVFQYVPGSHRWPVLRREKLFAHLPGDVKGSPHWPTWTQEDISRMCMDKIMENDAQIVPFVAQKGDVLIWHSALVHRGSPPIQPHLERKSLICHYSGLSARPDMPNRKQDHNGCWYFDLPSAGSVRP